VYVNSNKARFNYDMFRHKLQSTRRLLFKLYCQQWRSSQGYR